MCGIAGAYGSRELSRESVERASWAMRHRGPDGQGFYSNSEGPTNVSMVHRRLAIIDLEPRSNQPYRLGNHILVFNGEIYNYLELRSQLEAVGHTFHTTGDTEVLAHALLEWGVDALNRLEGMWAFAWFDETNKTLLLSRDRFGEKPLYIWENDGVRFFASEIKSLAALSGRWPSINQNHLLRFLVNGYKALYKTKEQFFNGVVELEPATWMLLRPDGSSTGRYWSPGTQQQCQLSYADAVQLTRESLVDAVRLRMRADVPLAFCMSGGVDSNTLISIARRVLDQTVHGFTIVNTDARYEEQTLVDTTVHELDIQHTAVPLSSSNFLDNMRLVVNAHDVPIYTISYYVHWQLMQAISTEGYKITISGTGADELFTGYYDHHNLYLNEVRDDPTLHQQALADWKKYQLPIVRNPFLRDPDLYLKDPSFRGHIYLNNKEFSSWLHAAWSEPFTEIDYGRSLLRNRMLNELLAEAVPVILHEDDINSMYFSMENRSPFLDRRLFDLTTSIPSRHLIRNARAKAVLRDAMKGIVPDEVLTNRRKVGFNAPVQDLLDARDDEVRSYVLDDSPIFDLVRKEAIEDLLASPELPNSSSKFLFSFISAKMFMENQQSHSMVNS